MPVYRDEGIEDSLRRAFVVYSCRSWRSVSQGLKLLLLMRGYSYGVPKILPLPRLSTCELPNLESRTAPEMAAPPIPALATSPTIFRAWYTALLCNCALSARDCLEVEVRAQL